MLRIGIDVGGTNTDAVLLRGQDVIAALKTPTTPDVLSGVRTALGGVVGDHTRELGAVMIGTTHFTNAVVQRRGLAPVAVIRLGAPATTAIGPMTGWPADLRAAVPLQVYLAHGGYEFDGRPLSAFDEDEVRGIARDIHARGVRNVAVVGVFAPINADQEVRAGEMLREEIPGARVTLSHTIGRVGLLERENAAILNASLQDLGADIVVAFEGALREAGVSAPFFLTQNDGTLMSAARAAQYPILTVASGPTNSMRGAAFLSGIRDAVVVDIGGTTTDVGAITLGFPRQASVAVDVGGVRTNFQMPDVLSVGLGGGSLVRSPHDIGPQSVGFRLTEEARVFGGHTLTASDIAVAAGLSQMGDPARVADLPPDFVAGAVARMRRVVQDAVDRVRLSAEPVPVILVGGGSVLIGGDLDGLPSSKPEHFSVANAVGAAIAQVSGEVEAVYRLDDIGRQDALDDAKNRARQAAIEAGANASTLEVVDVEDVALSYLPGNATRIRAKVVGDLRTLSAEPGTEMTHA